jgi:hypothetical protein
MYVLFMSLITAPELALWAGIAAAGVFAGSAA